MLGENFTPSLSALASPEERLVEGLQCLALQGLRPMYDRESHQYVQTLRGRPGSQGPTATAEGHSVRYSAICALGLARRPEAQVSEVLGGDSLSDLLEATRNAARAPGLDAGSIALTTWAWSEVTGKSDPWLLKQLTRLSEQPSMSVVELSWVLSAAVAAARTGEDTAKTARTVADRLCQTQGPGGIFPHWIGVSPLPSWRHHVGSFADQVYPIQSLARAAGNFDEPAWLRTACLTAEAICELQSADGQWWWHYDSRGRRVVERYPVYSVHQHAMAPMVMRDLVIAGGTDFSSHVLRGLRWLLTHPEVMSPLIDEPLKLVWRKVGRREPRKLVRGLSAISTAMHPRLEIRKVARGFPPTVIDYECRPYELGWLLYAWREDGSSGRGIAHGND